jgi:Cu-Zn family superoxide dismutase
MPQETRLVVLLAALSLSALSACGGDSDDANTTDSGADAGGKPDAAQAQDSSTTDTGSSADSGGSGSDAGKDAGGSTDAGADAGTGADGGMDAGAKTISSIYGGGVSVLDGGTSTAKGAALVVRTVAGHSLVSLQVSGLLQNKAYPAHVHVLPCAMLAGGHYQHVADAGATDSNEVWPALMTDDAGQARAFLDVDKLLRDEAVAVVVHDPDMANAKMLCADLATKTPFTTSGTPKALAGATDAGVSEVTGTASLTRADNGATTATISVQKLKPDTDYMVHVHDQPCAFANGGGHYKLDYGVTTAVEANEIWLNLKTDATGAGTKTTSVSNHVARAEAQAMVIHAMDATRLACIDLKL